MDKTCFSWVNLTKYNLEWFNISAKKKKLIKSWPGL